MNIDGCCDEIIGLLRAHGYNIGNKREINYGIQFTISQGEGTGIYRIYKSKRGIRLDSSQIRDENFRKAVDNITGNSALDKKINSRKKQSLDTDPKTTSQENIRGFRDPKRLIGIDESGKGDYFGPLIVAGVFTDERTSKILVNAGVKDSKKVKDNGIHDLADLIKNTCPYDIVVIENERYNELYATIRNLNMLLAWGHARVIENLLGRVDCNHALSDQFGRAELIEGALMERGSKIQLLQRTKAEDNISVAAASVLARDEFLIRLSNLEVQFDSSFPKGASPQVVAAGLEFAQRFGMESLGKVSKVHFKITDQIQKQLC